MSEQSEQQPEKVKAKWWRYVVGVFALAVIAIQFVPMGVTNAATNDAPKWDSPRTQELFNAACADCHSEKTKLLWFEHIAPIKWYVSDHVEEGRRALNVSRWHSAAGRDLDGLTKVILNHSMPLSSYTYLGLHSDANLTEAERQELVKGLIATAKADPPTPTAGGG